MNFRKVIACALVCAVFFSGCAYADGDQILRIVAPQSGSTVHDNSGNLSVTIAVVPPLHTGSDGRFVLLLDGKAVASGTGQHFNLAGIDRGSHVLRAQIQARDGRILVRSAPVEFHMWRASRLFRNRTD
ncbi:MAG: hypothetical protein LJE57_08545 [Gallionella sp.]|nr:hypothetical protein [Gallionella sp.]